MANGSLVVFLVFVSFAVVSAIMVGLCTLIRTSAFSALVRDGTAGVSVTQENYERILRSSARRARLAGILYTASNAVAMLGFLFAVSIAEGAANLVWMLVMVTAAAFLLGTVLTGWSLLGGRFSLETPVRDRPETAPIHRDE